MKIFLPPHWLSNKLYRDSVSGVLLVTPHLAYGGRIEGLGTVDRYKLSWIDDDDQASVPRQRMSMPQTKQMGYDRISAAPSGLRLPSQEFSISLGGDSVGRTEGPVLAELLHTTVTQSDSAGDWRRRIPTSVKALPRVGYGVSLTESLCGIINDRDVTALAHANCCRDNCFLANETAIQWAKTWKSRDTRRFALWFNAKSEEELRKCYAMAICDIMGGDPIGNQRDLVAQRLGDILLKTCLQPLKENSIPWTLLFLNADSDRKIFADRMFFSSQSEWWDVIECKSDVRAIITTSEEANIMVRAVQPSGEEGYDEIHPKNVTHSDSQQPTK